NTDESSSNEEKNGVEEDSDIEDGSNDNNSGDGGSDDNNSGNDDNQGEPTDPEKPVEPEEPEEPGDQDGEKPEEPTDPVPPVVDKTELKDIINEAEKLLENRYTDDSWNALQQTLNEANEIVQDKNATQNKIDKSKDNLKESMDNLILLSPVIEVVGV